MSERQTATLVVLDSLEALPRSLELGGGGGPAVLLTFCPDERITNDLKRYLAQRYSRVEAISAAGLLDKAALHVREEYGRLVAEAPDAIRMGGRTLREAFTFEGRLSLWWLNEIFGKRSDLYPTFPRLCQIQVIRDVAHLYEVPACYLVSRDREFWEVVLSYCQMEGIPLRSPRPRQPTLWLDSVSLPRIIVSSLAWFAQTMVETLVARLVARGQPQGETSEKPVCAFHTVYPAGWRGVSSRQDEKYGETLQTIQESGQLQPVYACTFAADGGHQWVGLGRFLHLCRWWRARQKEQGVPVYLLDSLSSVGDFLRTMAQLGLIWRYRRLEQAPAFQAHWRYGGVSFFPLVRRELRYAMKRTPRYLLHALRVRHFVQRVSPSAFVYHLFEYGLGRAIVYGVRTAGANTRLIGVQEGPVARRKLSSYHRPGELLKAPEHPLDFIRNLPLPDAIILEGQGAREILLESGYPARYLHIGGAPRVSALAHVPRMAVVGRPLAEESGRSRKRVVLVAFGAHDARPIITTCIPVMEQRDDYHFLFKLHPRGGQSPEDVEQRLAGHTLLGSYSIESQSVYQVLPRADVVVATYSSVAMEAAALGYPLVCLYLPDRVNATPLLDFDSPSTHFAANSQELMEALDRLLALTGSALDVDHHAEEYFFHSLNGSCAARWAGLIAHLVRDPVLQPGCRGDEGATADKIG